MVSLFYCLPSLHVHSLTHCLVSQKHSPIVQCHHHFWSLRPPKKRTLTIACRAQPPHADAHFGGSLGGHEHGSMSPTVRVVDLHSSGVHDFGKQTPRGGCCNPSGASGCPGTGPLTVSVGGMPLHRARCARQKCCLLGCARSLSSSHAHARAHTHTARAHAHTQMQPTVEIYCFHPTHAHSFHLTHAHSFHRPHDVVQQVA